MSGPTPATASSAIRPAVGLSIQDTLLAGVTSAKKSGDKKRIETEILAYLKRAKSDAFSFDQKMDRAYRLYRGISDNWDARSFGERQLVDFIIGLGMKPALDIDWVQHVFIDQFAGGYDYRVKLGRYLQKGCQIKNDRGRLYVLEVIVGNAYYGMGDNLSAIKSCDAALVYDPREDNHWAAYIRLTTGLLASRRMRSRAVHERFGQAASDLLKNHNLDWFWYRTEGTDIISIFRAFDPLLAPEQYNSFVSQLKSLYARSLNMTDEARGLTAFKFSRLLTMMFRSVNDFRQARALGVNLLKQAKSESDRSEAYSALASISAEEGDFEGASLTLEKAVAVGREAKRTDEEFRNSNLLLMIMYVLNENYDRAIDVLEKARPLATNKEWLEEVEFWLGVATWKQSKEAEALQHLKASNLDGSFEKRRHWSIHGEFLAEYLLKTRPSEALGQIELLINDITPWLRGPATTWPRQDLQRLPELQLKAADIAFQIGDMKKAEEHLIAAEAELGRFANASNADAAAIRRSRTAAQIASRLSLLRARRGETEEAYSTATRFQAVALQKSAGERKFRASAEGALAANSLRLALANEQRLVSGGFETPADEDLARWEASRLRRKYDDAFALAVGSVSMPNPPTPAERRALQDSKTLVLTYIASPYGIGVFLDDGANLSFSELPGKMADLTQAISAVQKYVTNPASTADEADIRALSDILLPSAVQGRVKAADRLAVIPCGPLWQVPFSALAMGGEPLGLQKRVVEDVSVEQVLAGLRQPVGSGLVIGTAMGDAQYGSYKANYEEALLRGGTAQTRLRLANSMKNLPPLPGSRREAVEVGKVWDTTPVLGSSATETALRKSLSLSDVVHVACHGIFDDTHPQFSGLVLSRPKNDTLDDDGALLAYELDSMSVRSRLVILRSLRAKVSWVSPEACEQPVQNPSSQRFGPWKIRPGRIS